MLWQKGDTKQQNTPVRHVTYFGALLYAQAQGRDLPTEAEWERAAAHGKYVEQYCGYKTTIEEADPENPGSTR
jgi:formylglycine-generating enzyme required for sulfatase activity